MLRFLHELRISSTTKGVTLSKVKSAYYEAPDKKKYLLSDLKTYSVKRIGYVKNRMTEKNVILIEANEQGNNDYFTYAVFEDENKQPKYALIYYKRQKKNIIPQQVAKKSGFNVVVEKGASEALNIQSANMLFGAKRKTVLWMGSSVQAFVFENSDQLKTVLTKNIKKHPKLKKIDGLVDALTDFIHGGAVKINWPEGVSDKTKREIAKYLGEIFVGIGFMDKTITNVPFKEEVLGFAVPVDVKFSGVDSFVITERGMLIPLSSKSGTGAKASLFTNVLDVAQEGGYTFQDEILSGLQQTALRGGDGIRNQKDSKMILYSYMLRKVLSMSDLDVPDARQLYKDLFSGYGSVKKKYPDFVKKLRVFKWRNKEVKKLMARFPASFTAMLTREVAYRINHSKKARDEILTVLGIKRFFQASLNIQKFVNDGSVEYKFIASDKNDVLVVGNKSPINDLQARQGLLNYQIR